MTVIARMICHSKKKVDGGMTRVELGFVYSNDPNHPNKVFTDATPSGSMVMIVAAGRAAADAFEQGKEYDVTVNPATGENQHQGGRVRHEGGPATMGEVPSEATAVGRPPVLQVPATLAAAAANKAVDKG